MESLLLSAIIYLVAELMKTIRLSGDNDDTDDAMQSSLCSDERPTGERVGEGPVFEDLQSHALSHSDQSTGEDAPPSGEAVLG